MSRPCITHHHACDCREAMFVNRLDEGARHIDALYRIIDDLAVIKNLPDGVVNSATRWADKNRKPS
jgi:hypothetical protein